MKEPLPPPVPTAWELRKQEWGFNVCIAVFIFLVIVSSGLALLAAPWFFNPGPKGSKGS